jgi:hypothetical protein
MNKLILIFTIIFSHVCIANSLPSNWVKDVGQDKKVSQVSSVQAIISDILNTQNEVLEEASNHDGEFKLSHYSTGFSVSRAGRIGLSSLNAKKSVSVYWKRKSVPGNELEQTLNLISTNNQKIMNNQFSGALNLISNLNLGIDLISLGVNLKDYFANMNKLFEQISTDKWNQWQFDGLRTDLFIGIDGTISQVFMAGVALRLRIEWKHKSRDKVKKSKSSLSRLVRNLLQDIDYALKRHQIGDFDLNRVYIGVGHSSTLGLFGIANTSQSLMAYARFVRGAEINQEAQITSEEEDYSLISNSNKKGIGKLFRIKRSRWRRGLIKALKMSDTFVEAAHGESANWEVFRIKSAFEVNYRGWLGFSSKTTNATIEFEFLKNDTNYVEYPSQNTDIQPKWFMELIRLKIRLEAGFKIPFLASAKIYPEMEFYWVR